MNPSAHIRVSAEDNGVWYEGVDNDTGHVVQATRYGREYLTQQLKDMGYLITTPPFSDPPHLGRDGNMIFTDKDHL